MDRDRSKSILYKVAILAILFSSFIQHNIEDAYTQLLVEIELGVKSGNILCIS